VTIDVNGQQITVSGLSSTQVQQLQSQIGHMYTIQVTQSNGSYQITAGTSPQEQTSGTAQVNVTPTSNQTPAAGVNVPGTISFIGTVQSVGTSSISVKMPNGETLPVTITISTDRKDFPTVLPGNGQWVKVDAFTNPDGSFAAKSLDMVKAKDLADPTKVNKVDFKGVTTSAVASNNVLNFGVGNKHYSFTINPATTQIKNFVSAQAIQSGQPIEVTVLFTNGSPNVLEVKNGLD
jgi:hypothetical protein